MLRIISISIFTIFGLGCTLTVKPDFQSELPQDRLAAIAQARRTADPSAVGPLIELLSSDDPLIRAASIDTLHELTHESFGYTPGDPRMERQQAASRWAQWYMQRGKTIDSEAGDEQQ